MALQILSELHTPGAPLEVCFSSSFSKVPLAQSQAIISHLISTAAFGVQSFFAEILVLDLSSASIGHHHRKLS